MKKINFISQIDWLILSLFIFIPRLLNLDVFLTPDEPIFLEHAQDFAEGLATHHWNLTLGIGYPAVTVAWWAAPVVNLAQTELGAYVAGRITTALANGILLLILYGLTRKLLGRWPAFIGLSLLALDPFSLGYSRLLHNDFPLSLFMTLAGLSFLFWLREMFPLSAESLPEQRSGLKNGRLWLFLTGVFTGLAFLTKSTALVMGPMFVALLVGWAISYHRSRLTPLVSRSMVQFFLKGIAGLVIVALLAAVVFFAVWPAMWWRPDKALALTFGKLITDQEAGTGNSGFFWMGRFLDDPGPFYYPVDFLLKATPWLLVGLAISLWSVGRHYLARSRPGAVQNLSDRPERNTYALSLALWFFAFIYLIMMTIASKKTGRYLLPVFPTFYLLTGLAFFQMGRWVNKLIAAPPLRFLLLLPAILMTWFYHPYYLTYYNPTVLGWRWASQAILVGWGEGLDEAARYVSRQSPGEVTTWYGQLFSAIYPGELETARKSENFFTSDYTVLYINQVQRDIPNPNVVHYFRTHLTPEYTVRLAGIDYAWVYRGPRVGFLPDPALQYPLGGDFGGEVHLLGYNLSQPQLSGQPLIMTLYWRVLAAPPAGRFVYVRLVDAQGRVWAKSDGPPVMGLWPMPYWVPGLLVEDAQELSIPPGTPPGQYRLEVGWYDSASGQPLSAGGQPLGQGGGLLLGEVKLGWQALSAETDLPGRTNTALASNARLSGYDSPPPAATTGDLLPIRLDWREAGALFNLAGIPNNYVMFEWRQAGQPVAEQLDPLPFPIEEWGRNASLRSQHEVIVPPKLADGRYELAVRLHTGSDPAGEAFTLGPVEVSSPPHQFDRPAGALSPAGPARLDQEVSLAGYALEPGDQSLKVNLYWQTGAVLTRRYKVFTQLLTADNTLVAQSDRFPADGQRPTTGWLPGEIITDTHTLAIPPNLAPGKYHLITGLYDPLTGQRLPVLNASDDAIEVVELTWP